jgi:hypothetical protein
MKFVKEHLIGIVLGLVLYEFYIRSMARPGQGGGGA